MDKCHWLFSQWHMSINQVSKSVIDRGQWHKKMSLTVSILSLDTIHQTSDIAEYSEINLLSLFWWLRTVIDAWQSQWPNNNMWHGTAAVILGMFHLVGNSCLFCLLCLQKNVTLSFNLAATSAFSLLLIPKPDFRPCKSPKNVTGWL